MISLIKPNRPGIAGLRLALMVVTSLVMVGMVAAPSNAGAVDSLAEIRAILNAKAASSASTRNSVAVRQQGQGNQVAIRQSGKNNHARIHQFGSDNHVGATQSGNGNKMLVFQFGSGLSYDGVQTGGQSRLVIQRSPD